MRIVVLTSSRADYGIYLPLLKRLEKDAFFDLKIIAFGTHLSSFHGYTIKQIEADGFEIIERVESLVLGDSATAVSSAIGLTVVKFAAIWERLKDEVDLVLTLGDRYEMFAAVSAAVPFNLKIAHFHGGETTLGAIDNVFRHAISLMSSIHFAATQPYCDRIAEITGSEEHIYNVGALSLDNFKKMDLLSKADFQTQFDIDITMPTILVTFHPETVSLQKNEVYTEVLVKTFEKLTLKYQIIITMPNADTMGNLIRTEFLKLEKEQQKVICVESFGKLGYFSCMKHCTFLLGNTSSGIIEAASFGKFVINVGDRQKGRARSGNVIDVAIEEEKILNAVSIIKKQKYKGENIYHLEESSKSVAVILKANYS